MLEKIINNIEEYINYCKDNGSSRIELSQEILQQIPILPFDISDKPKQNTAPKSKKVNFPQNSSSQDSMNKLAEMIAGCSGCSLGETRTDFVLGEGSLSPEIMFIGEAPGADEDKTGRPFVGPAGQLLTKMLAKLDLSKEEIYLANILKCRPPNNRKPTEEETKACIPYIEYQIDLLKPKVIVTLGGTAVNSLFNSNFKITEQRGVWMDYKGIPVMPTYHPSYLLRAQKKRWETWHDMIEVFKKIDKPLPDGVK